jgi:hypothetical protein
MSLSDQRGTRIDERLDNGRGSSRWRMRGEPVRVAASGHMSSDIEQILRREAKTR